MIMFALWLLVTAREKLWEKLYGSRHNVFLSATLAPLLRVMISPKLKAVEWRASAAFDLHMHSVETWLQIPF